jgi:hypothetical protein
MQTHGRPSNPHERLALTHVIGEDPLLDEIELAGDIVGIAIDSVDPMLDDDIPRATTVGTLQPLRSALRVTSIALSARRRR